MIPQPAPSSDSISASVPAFAQRVALSVLALEIDELLRRSEGDSGNPRASLRFDSASSRSVSLNPQPTHTS